MKIADLYSSGCTFIRCVVPKKKLYPDILPKPHLAFLKTLGAKLYFEKSSSYSSNLVTPQQTNVCPEEHKT